MKDKIVEQKFAQTDKLSNLLHQRPDLFEEFNGNDFQWADLSESDLECLTECGAAGWISTDDLDADRMRFYRFRWSDVEEFGIAPIDDLARGCMSNLIQVRAPKFELYQLVIVYWNDEEHVTQVVRRWLDLDDGEGAWWYKVQGLDRPFPEQVVGPRDQEPQT